MIFRALSSQNGLRQCIVEAMGCCDNIVYTVREGWNNMLERYPDIKSCPNLETFENFCPGEMGAEVAGQMGAYKYFTKCFTNM